jgi:hypothetical protein
MSGHKWSVSALASFIEVQISMSINDYNHEEVHDNLGLWTTYINQEEKKFISSVLT